MKKAALILTVIILVFSLSGCSISSTNRSKNRVEINLPVDNSVNGYRIYGSETENNSDCEVSTQSEENYCANIKTGVFHKSECGSVNTMKEGNKLYFSDRNYAVENNYKPCKKCNP